MALLSAHRTAESGARRRSDLRSHPRHDSPSLTDTPWTGRGQYQPLPVCLMTHVSALSVPLHTLSTTDSCGNDVADVSPGNPYAMQRPEPKHPEDRHSRDAARLLPASCRLLDLWWNVTTADRQF
ncbi:hypothetical protein NSPZN2_11382 [Nitrospira defluvii]|uniref:Uncharacterized protein n=1 Tax=Nitrospira defluvii TaxID=330214 RepID=A0ABM8QTD6_9BACT|nr:hypothetical protein NSPZN2_11382 [Nitrospira defluvii]